ncbi:MAG: hypothetical protein ABEJ90_00840 [Halobacterium sp.]
MTERLHRLQAVVAGTSLVAAGVVVVVANLSATWPGPDVTAVALVAGVFAVGFALAAVLHEVAGQRRRGVGSLLAVLGWLTLLAGELVEVDAVTAVGVAVVLAAGAYLVRLGLE